MNLEQINQLREKLKTDRVMWAQFGDAYEINRVPIVKCDPDITGVLDYIAIFTGGHIDLSNVDAEDFYIFKPLFDDQSGVHQEKGLNDENHI